MKQLILVGNQKVKFQDTETIISLTLVSDGNTVTIDKTKTYSIKIKNGTGYVKAIDATPDTTNNMVTFSTSGLDGLPVDAYFIELWVIDNNGQTIYPSDSFIEVDITANATGVEGQVLPAITMQEFEERFSTLQSNLETKVGTLIGPTGPTGNGINKVVTQYQLSSSGSEVPISTWSDSPVTPTDDLPYMWTRTTTTYTDKSTHVSYNISAKGTKGNNFTIQGSTSSIAGLPSVGTDGEGYMVGTELYVWTNGKWNDIVNMKGVQGDKGDQGIQGLKGDTGTGISSITTEYELSKQGTAVPSTGWSSTLLTMTNDLPYLWTRVTITFTDGSKNMVYFTSNKGDKGDTGEKGDKGDTGANLAVKGAVDKDTDLPSSGNTEGDAYLVGTDLYVYTSGAWKDCGPIVAENTVLYNADGSLNVNGTNYNYVQDLRNGKIQYNDGTNNIELTPVDSQQEAKDILSARNYTDSSISSLSTSINTKLSGYATNSQLATKADDSKVVHDNQDGTEQLNGVQVQPYNKLSDTIGGVNYIKDGNFSKSTPNWTMPDYSDSGIAEIISDDTSGKNYYHWRAKSDTPFTGPSQTIQQAFSQGDQLTLTLTAHADQATNMSIYIHEQDANGNTMASGNYDDTVNLTATDSLITWHWAIRNDCDSLWIQFSNYLRLTNDYYITNVQFEKGSIATDWTPAPEDKVNVSDMRKPASDVAGIEEVNAKQDKIGYTPADDSKVVHNTGNEEIAGTKTFDTAPIDKKTGNPYITKDGVPAVPSTLADTTKLSNFTAGLQKGGVDVATQTDLQSIIATHAYTLISDGSDLNNYTSPGIYLWQYSTNYTTGLTNYYKKNLMEPFIMYVKKDSDSVRQDIYLVGGMGNATRYLYTSNSTPTWGSWAYSTAYLDAISNQGITLEINDTNYSINDHEYTFLNSDNSWALNTSVGNLNSTVTNQFILNKNSYISNSPFTSTTDYLLIKVYANGTNVVQEASLLSDLLAVKKRYSSDSGSTWSAWTSPFTYQTAGTDADAVTLIASLQSSGYSGMVGVPES